MLPSKKKMLLKLSIGGNFLTLLVIIGLIVVFNDQSNSYTRFGPSKDLFVVSVLIDTWTRYIGVVAIISFLSISDVLVNEFAGPIFGFSIYNPDKKIISDFSKAELQLMANVHFLITSVRSTLGIIVVVSQLDLALISTVVKELTAVFTVRYLLNQKQFRPAFQNNNYSTGPEDEELSEFDNTEDSGPELNS